MGSKYRFFSFIFTWSLFHLGMSSPEDILNQIRVTHEKIGTCRLRCLSELSTSEQDSVCFRIPKCRTCWDLCQRFALNKKDEQVFCARHDPEICDDTCQLSCKSLQVETMKESLIRTPSVVLSTSFVGCTLFWKTNYDNTNIAFINQLYGVDDQDTWFDLGQTTESFYTLLPRQSDRVARIRLVAITAESGSVAETEISFVRQRCDSNIPEVVGADEMVGGSTNPDQGPKSSSVFIVTAVMLVFAFLLIFVLVVCLRKDFLCAKNVQFGRFRSHRTSENHPQVELKNQSFANTKTPINNLSFYV